MIYQLLEIRLLGPVEIKFEGKIININRRIERAILYILAIEHKPVSREKLIDLIWPDADQINPRAALRTALSRLRNELLDIDLIMTELDKVWLNPDRCYIDLIEFENQYSHLENLLSAYQNFQTLPAAIVNQISSTLDIWHGDNLIAGDNLSYYQEIEHFCKSRNLELNHKRQFLLRRLAEHYQSGGNLEKALTTYTKLTRVAPSDISIQCAILDILNKMGRHQDVISYCDRLEEIYEVEFNAPLPAEIINRCCYSQSQMDSLQFADQAEWPSPSPIQLELIGRQFELIQLHQAFQKGGLVSLKGEMGSGKTRLAQELYQTLSPKPMLLFAPSGEIEKSLPFSPIIHCLRHSLPVDIWKEIDPIWVNQLRLLLPELVNILQVDDLTPISKLTSGKQNIFDALLHVCQHISKRYGRILFFLDDAHWADGQTLQALSYLMSKRFFSNQGLLLIASRSEERNPDLDLVIDQAFRSHPVQIIELGGLTPDEVMNLARQVMDQRPPETFINKLYQETSGNPFLTLEIIHNILDSQDDLEYFEATSSLPLPMNVHALLRKRLSQLDQTSRHILLCAAVLDHDLSIDLLQSVAEVTPLEISKQLTPLQQSRFILSTQKGSLNGNHLVFSNEKLREVVLKEASAGELQIIHRKVAQEMAANSQYSDKAPVIAEHFLLGGDNENAFQWLLRTADHAWSLGIIEEAEEAYQQAEEILMNSTEGIFSAEDYLHLFEQWGEFAYYSNQTDLLEQLGAKLKYLGGQKNNALLTATSQVLSANACFLRLEFDTALDLIDDAIETFEIIDQKQALIKAVKRKSVLCWWIMDYDKAEKAARRVIELTQQIDLPEHLQISLEYNALYFLSHIKYTQGEAKAALHDSEHLHKKYFDKLELIDRLKSYYLLAHVNMISANYQSCEDYASQGLEIANLLGNTFTKEAFLLCLSKVKFIQGELDQAYQYAHEALQSAERENRKPSIITANCLLGDIFRILQSYTMASQYYRVGQIREGFSNLSPAGIQINTHLAQMLAWTNQISEAKELLRKNLAIIEKHGLSHHHTEALLAYGICYMNDGNISESDNYFSRGIQIAEQKGMLYESIVNKIGRILLMISKHQIQEAQEHLDEVLKISQSKNMVWATLNGLQIATKLYSDTNQLEMINKNRMFYHHLIKNIEENVKSEPLKQAFINAKEVWDQDYY